MFINLTHIPFAENTLNSYKFRVLVLCPELTAQDLIEENDEYESYRSFLFSKIKKTVFIIVINLMTGDIPRICELSNNGDRLLNYEETKRFLVNHIVCRTGKELNISISPEHQETIETGVRDAVRKARQLADVPISIPHYEHAEVPSFDFSINKDTRLITRAAYNFGCK